MACSRSDIATSIFIKEKISQLPGLPRAEVTANHAHLQSITHCSLRVSAAKEKAVCSGHAMTLSRSFQPHVFSQHKAA